MPSRRAFLAAFGAGGAAFAGCSAIGDETPKRQVAPDWTPGPKEWAAPAYDYSGASATPHASPPDAEPTEVRTVTSDDDVEGSSQVLVANGTVYHRGDTTLTAYEFAEPAEAWTRQSPYGGFTRYVDERPYDVGRGRLTALSLDGERVWSAGEVEGTWLHEREGYVYLSSYRGGIEWYDADSGDRAGELDANVLATAFADGVLYTAEPEAVVAYGFDDGTPEETWRTDEAVTAEWHSEEAYDRADPPAPPSPALAVADGVVHVVERPADMSANQARLVLLDDDGRVFGDVGFDRFVSSPTVGDRIYLTATKIGDDWTERRDGEVLSFDGTDLEWATEVDSPMGFFLAGSTLLGSSADLDGESTSITAIDSDDGDVAWTYAGARALAAVDETVYAVGNDSDGWSLVALRE